MTPIIIEKIIRTKRRSISLIIDQNAKLVVRAPLRTPDKVIENFVQEKSLWIRQKIDEMEERPKASKKEFVNGENFLYLGEYYELRIIESGTIDIELTDTLCISRRILPYARNYLKDWYKAEAKRIILERSAFFIKITGYSPFSIKISNAEKRWGSCTSKGTINFSWRLIMAPMEIIDYVIVHEMVHLNQPDHSKIFWDKVGRILPDYKDRKKWLKENDLLLAI